MSKNIIANLLEKYRSDAFTPLLLFEFQKDGNWYKYTNLDVPFAIRENVTYVDGLTVTVNSTKIDDDLTWFALPIAIDTSVSGVPSDFFEGKGDGDWQYLYATLGDTQLAIDVEVFDTTNEVAKMIISWAGEEISSSSDTDIIIYFDYGANPRCGQAGSTAPQDIYDNNTLGTYHLQQNPTAPIGSILDSTDNNYDGDTFGSMVSGDVIDGYFGKAIDFNGVNQGIAFGNHFNSCFEGDDARATLELVFQLDNIGIDDNEILFAKDYDYSGQKGFRIEIEPVTSISGGIGNLYATWNNNSHRRGSKVTLDSSQLESTHYNGTYTDQYVMGTLPLDTTKKYYWEHTIDTAGNVFIVGIDRQTSKTPGGSSYGVGYKSDGKLYYGIADHSWGETYTTGDVIGVAVDMTTEQIWFSKNGVWLESGDPEAGTNEAYVFNASVYELFPKANNSNTANAVMTTNFGESTFTYSVPSGFLEGVYIDYNMWSPENYYSGTNHIVLSNNNRTAKTAYNSVNRAYSHYAVSSGKWYWEYTIDAFSYYSFFGIDDGSGSNNVGDDVHGYAYVSNGKKNHSGQSSYGVGYGTGSVISVALDLDNGKIWFAKNGVWQASGDPEAGTNAAFTGIAGTYYAAISLYSTVTTVTANFGQSAFTYSVPSGFNPGLYGGTEEVEYVSGAKLSVVYRNDDFERRVTSSGTIDLDTNYHTAITYNGSIDTNDGLDRVSIWTNGVEDALVLETTSGTLDVMDEENVAWAGLAARFDDIGTIGSNTFNGQIDEFTIHDTVRSDAWIKARYEAFNQTLTTFSGVSVIAGEENFVNTTTASGLYMSRKITIESISHGMNKVISDATLTIDNTDSVMSYLAEEGTLRDEAARVYAGIINTDTNLLVGLMLYFEGEVDSYDLVEKKLRLVVGSPFSRWNRVMTNRHTTSCRWKVFGGSKCQYSGTELTCDRSYTRCKALGNTANFSGFRWLPTIENKRIQWGPTYSEYK